jgi:hypothetical protein
MLPAIKQREISHLDIPSRLQSPRTGGSTQDLDSFI